MAIEHDFKDTEGFYTTFTNVHLGHDFEPADIHAGGLRYHGAGTIVSHPMKDKLIEATPTEQLESFEAGVLFAQAEGIIPAQNRHTSLQQPLRSFESKRRRKRKSYLIQSFRSRFN